jgi:small-conductance mechanosensitive channel
LVDTLLAKSGSIIDDEETVQYVKRTHETIDDFGYMRRSTKLVDEDEVENEDDAEENEADNDDAHAKLEDATTKEQVNEDDVIKVPQMLQRLNAIKRGAKDIELNRKAVRDPSPRHTRSGKRL